MAGYERRCIEALKRRNAPLEGWYCVGVYDLREEESAEYETCELCGYERIRFVHVMEHYDYDDSIRVGCICAGVMEGDLLGAKERERVLRNRYNRKRNYLKKQWDVSRNGNRTLLYKNNRITIMRSHFDFGGWGIIFEGRSVWRRDNRKIKDFRSAVNVAFDLVDPPDEPL